MIQPGSRLAHYEVVSALGKGGMGEVWRARDARLGREVAIKALPAEFAQDTERLARFEREARLLASLNHSNIAAIYGIEEYEGSRFLVLELVEGETLADRIAHGPIPLPESLELALQVTAALEAAHAQGVIHRDLKPGNIKLTPEGNVKVLDFGLAKALSTDAANPALSHSPTLSLAATQQGVILGTAAYMSPEQARGVEVDASTDVWAFGAVLFEMVTGRKAFQGEMVTDVMASVLKSDPDYGALPGGVDPRLHAVLHRCLEKDRKRRYRHIGDVQLELEAIRDKPLHAPVAAGAGNRRILPLAVIGILIVAVLVLGGMLLRTPTNSSAVVRSSITLPLDQRLQNMNMAFSPDGSVLAFAPVSNGRPEICLRDLDGWELRCLGRGTNPFFAPDGNRVGFQRDNALWSVSVDGESPIPWTESAGLGAAWGTDGSIVYNASYNQGLARIETAGATPVPLTTVDPESGELGHFWPQFLPDGNTVLYTVFTPNLTETRVAAVRIDTGEVTPLVENASFGRYVASGHLLFVRANNLFAVAFDPDELVWEGTPEPVLDDMFVDPGNGGAFLAVSSEGTLAYVPASMMNPDLDVVWVEEDGSEEVVPGLRGPYTDVRISPDGERVALVRRQANPDIEIFEFENQRRTRFTLGGTSEGNPVWTPLGSHVVYFLDSPPYDLFRQAIDRSTPEELLLANDNDKQPRSVSPDGMLVYTESTASGGDIWTLPLDPLGMPEPFLVGPFDEQTGVVSPDGRWIAYVSNESGEYEVYVRTFPGGANPERISTDGGGNPQWSLDGRTLYYRREFAMLAAAVDGGRAVGTPEVLFEKETRGYAIGPDGRFLMVAFPSEAQPREIRIITNWFEDLVKRLGPN